MQNTGQVDSFLTIPKVKFPKNIFKSNAFKTIKKGVKAGSNSKKLEKLKEEESELKESQAEEKEMANEESSKEDVNEPSSDIKEGEESGDESETESEEQEEAFGELDLRDKELPSDDEFEKTPTNADFDIITNKKEQSRKSSIWIIVDVVVILAIVFGVGYFMYKKGIIKISK